MLKVRRLLVPIVTAWLFLYAIAVTGTAALVLDSRTSALNMACTCAHDSTHRSCPMHHQPADSARCHLQGTHQDVGLALRAALGPLTLPGNAIVTNVEVPSAGPVTYISPSPLDWVAPPDLPPPRS
jgi:hypothetical protein